MKQQITENKVNLRFGKKNVQVTLVTLCSETGHCYNTRWCTLQ